MTRLERSAVLFGALGALGALGFGTLACNTPPDAEPGYDLEALQDPATCEECHPTHYREWLGSMHAYAAEDPVFRAMNAKGQRDTNGELGDFCVKCHAPMAVELGLTEDGLNLDEVPQKFQGVTCYFCHQVEAVEGTHNNPLRLAMDGVMRGSISDALAPEVHGVEASPLFNRNRVESSDLCGSCHDIVTPGGAHIERTYHEWLESFYGDPDPDDLSKPALWGLSCNDCHMDKSVGPIADYPGVPGDRSVHSHMFVGTDVALTDFPDAELGPQLRAEQLEAIEDQRKTSLCATLCVREQTPGEGDGLISVWLHNEAAGHAWPSGSTPDRRAWLELVGSVGEELVFSTGVVGEDAAIAELDDPNLWLFRDRIFDAEGAETHDFWAAYSYESELLPAPTVFGSTGDAATWRSRQFSAETLPERVEMRVQLRPIGLEILAELVDSGDLDPAIADAMATYTVEPSVLTWTPELGEVNEDPEVAEAYGTCVSSSPGCVTPELQGL